MPKIWGEMACFDVYYYGNYAKASSVVFETEPYERVVSQYSQIIKSIDDYIPGEFYKRELPCLLCIYERIKEDIVLIIVDGYVTLKNGQKGLGGHLFAALGHKIPVIGVAKTFYKGSQNYLKVYRGNSGRPLFISSMGIDLNFAATFIKNLQGENRIPDVLKKVDKLTKT